MLLNRSLLVAIIALVLLPLSSLAAPITRTVGDRFQITLQYIHEPAILGDTNGVRMQITENGEPVVGAHTTLAVQVEYMEAVRVLNMLEDPGQPGVYTGVFIPMQEGEYTFNVSGNLDGVDINETYTVADGLVNVTPRTDYEFPNVAQGWALDNLAAPIAATALIGLAVLAVSRRTQLMQR
jgi:hypothetical protein